ncbi:MAG: iron-sulfur cluster repair di-iron protein [Bacteroidetes bacterium]|nr:iron-sulfur cluster repair di-iron protein [Bacteroidota bacterium]MCB9043568.1 iron-sulfur cluster repair di-iron protein [Chitinophagales bacterium]
MLNITKENTVGEIVAQNYHTASVFKAQGIDFCCKGNTSIAAACANAQVDADLLIDELNNFATTPSVEGINFGAWDLDLLSEYIEKKHHRYVAKKTPEILAYLNKIANVHGNRHPELIEILEIFTASAQDLSKHMKKEELILFPYIKKLAISTQKQSPNFGTVQNPIAMMQEEHELEGVRFAKIAALSNNYTPPEDACNTYKVAYAMLQEFENDLHLHIHLENNILFPKAIAIETQLN